MVDFNLTDEQLALQDTARKFAQSEMIPQAAHFDQTGEFPQKIIEKAWQAGLLNEQIPEEYGGAGLDTLSTCVLVEELAAASVTFTEFREELVDLETAFMTLTKGKLA